MDQKVGIIGKDAKIDAYMKCSFKGKNYRTKTLLQYCDEKKEPINWNQEFWLPAQLPVLVPKILFKLMDEDKLMDETAGSVCFYTKELVELAEQKKGDKDLKERALSILGHKSSNPTSFNPTNGRYNDMFMWKNIYGSPMDQKDSKSKRAMNENPEMASTWKGRVLFQVNAEKVDKALSKTMTIEEDALAAAEEAMISKEYAIIAQVGQAIALPTAKKYKVKITVGGFEMLFDPFTQKE